MIRIAGLQELASRLAQFDITDIQRQALDQAATTLHQAVHESLSKSPGATHDTPWLRTGNLRASIDHQNDDTLAIVGSTSQVAVVQEDGSRNTPPRPFLAPAAASHGEQLAHNIADAIAAGLRQLIQGDTR